MVKIKINKIIKKINNIKEQIPNQRLVFNNDWRNTRTEDQIIGNAYANYTLRHIFLNKKKQNSLNMASLSGIPGSTRMAYTISHGKRKISIQFCKKKAMHSLHTVQWNIQTQHSLFDLFS